MWTTSRSISSQYCKKSKPFLVDAFQSQAVALFLRKKLLHEFVQTFDNKFDYKLLTNGFIWHEKGRIPRNPFLTGKPLNASHILVFFGWHWIKSVSHEIFTKRIEKWRYLACRIRRTEQGDKMLDYFFFIWALNSLWWESALWNTLISFVLSIDGSFAENLLKIRVYWIFEDSAVLLLWVSSAISSHVHSWGPQFLKSSYFQRYDILHQDSVDAMHV